MSAPKMVEILQRLSEELDGLATQLDKALTKSRKLSRVVGLLAENALERIHSVEQTNKE